MLNEKEAASYIGMSVSYLRHARYDGVYGDKQPGPLYVKMGRAVRYRSDDLDEWIEQRVVRKGSSPGDG